MSLDLRGAPAAHDEFEAWHHAEHPEPVADCFACKLDTVQMDARIQARRTTRYVSPAKPDNPWERGVAGEHRVDGSFMPYIGPDYEPIGVKQFAENRSRYEKTIRRNKAGVSPVSTP